MCQFQIDKQKKTSPKQQLELGTEKDVLCYVQCIHGQAGKFFSYGYGTSESVKLKGHFNEITKMDLPQSGLRLIDKVISRLQMNQYLIIIIIIIFIPASQMGGFAAVLFIMSLYM